MDSPATRRARAWCVHLTRVGLLAAILAVIHFQHSRLAAVQRAQPMPELPLASIKAFFPSAERLGNAESHGGRLILDHADQALGYVIQTAPESDPFLGFSGSTNCLVAFGPRDEILGALVLSSRDTRDHVDLIVRDRSFLKNWNGLTWDQAAAKTEIDGVAGATLTSLAIVQGLQQRLGASPKSLKFPQPLTLDDARPLFALAASITPDHSMAALWHVLDDQNREIGLILRTSPAADNIVGFQGPTETRIGIGGVGQIVGVTIGSSFDNEPYVTYVRDDEYFKSLFKKFDLSQLGQLDLQKAKIEGVSGATMTSIAVAQGIVKAAQEHEAALRRARQERSAYSALRWRTAGTLAIVALGIVMGFTRLRGLPWFRVTFQVLLIAYLGLANGELLSMAMFIGWGQSGVPWPGAIGLVALAAAALILPISNGQNVYCSHLCPHGAAQQLLPRWWNVRRRLPRWLVRSLRLIRPLLLAWILLVAICHWPFSLVDIEPFDAYSWRAAAWPTIVVAIVGLAASLFIPMAYCRYGCPTGAVLEYLRRHSRSDRLTRADVFAAGCLLIGVVLPFLFPTMGVAGR